MIAAILWGVGYDESITQAILQSLIGFRGIVPVLALSWVTYRLIERRRSAAKSK